MVYWFVIEGYHIGCLHRVSHTGDTTAGRQGHAVEQLGRTPGIFGYHMVYQIYHTSKPWLICQTKQSSWWFVHVFSPSHRKRFWLLHPKSSVEWVAEVMWKRTSCERSWRRQDQRPSFDVSAMAVPTVERANFNPGMAGCQGFVGRKHPTCLSWLS